MGQGLPGSPWRRMGARGWPGRTGRVLGLGGCQWALGWGLEPLGAGRPGIASFPAVRQHKDRGLARTCGWLVCFPTRLSGAPALAFTWRTWPVSKSGGLRVHSPLSLLFP